MLSGTHENGCSDGRGGPRFGPGTIGMQGVVTMIKGEGMLSSTKEKDRNHSESVL